MSEAIKDFDDLSSEQVILSAPLQAERLLRRLLEPGQTLPLAEIFSEAYLPQAELAMQETLGSGIRPN